MRIVRSGLTLLPTLLVCGLLGAGSAHADALSAAKCRAAIGKSGAAFAQAKMKLLQKCREGFAKKSQPSDSCATDVKTVGKIQAAQSKAKAAIVKTCAGNDGVCDDPLSDIWGTTTDCPNFENSQATGCSGALAPSDCTGIGTCLTCIDEVAVDQAIDLSYADLVTGLNVKDKANKVRLKCQVTIGKSAAAFFSAKSKALQKCWNTVNAGKSQVPCPPAAFAGTPDKTRTAAEAAISKAQAKFDNAICKACGGSGKPCDITASTVTLTRADVGFPPNCPPVVIPGVGGHTCDFGRTLVSMEDVRDCVECVTEFKADCLSAAAATGFPSAPAYPTECNVVLPATPTRTATPTPTITPTGTITSTPVLTGTATTTPSGTVTATPTVTVTATGTITPTPTRTLTPAQTATATRTASPTITATPTVGPTATKTATPTPTVTASPGLCGNGTLDAGEDCDPAGGTATSCQTVSNTGPGFTCSASCQCACPAFVEFTGTSTIGILDTGWTGLGHDATVVSDGKVTVGVTSCPGASRPCGVCSLLGPVDNLNAATYPSAAGPSKDLNAHRCTNNTSVVCATNTPCFEQCVGGTNDAAACTGPPACLGGANNGASCTSASQCPGGSCNDQCPSGICAAAGTCEYQFGTYLPLAAGGVATCVGNQINGTISGTANIESGASATAATLISKVYSGPTSGEPCPRCLGDTNANDGHRGGTCSSGQRATKACDINGVSVNTEWGATSLDCPPLAGGVIASLNIDLSNTTGTKTRTLSTANPLCSNASFATNRCQCDTCNNGSAQVCSTNADCPISGGNPGICGGKRCISGANQGAPCTVTSQCPGSSCNTPGIKTQPSQCDGGAADCTGPDNKNCVGGGNAGALCAAASECPGGVCQGTSVNDKTCATGPFEQFCGPTETFLGCTSNADCGFAGDTCSITRFRECFDTGTVGDVVTASGVQSAPVHDQSDPTLAALFCVGPTASSAVNGAAGLPGLGRLELGGHAQGLP